MEHYAKIVNDKNSFAKSLICYVWESSEYASVRCVTRFIEWKNLCELSKKKTVVDKFLIHDFMNLIQRYEISQDIWEKIFPLSSIPFTSKVAFIISFCNSVWVAVYHFNERCVDNMFSISKQPGSVFPSKTKLQIPGENFSEEIPPFWNG